MDRSVQKSIVGDEEGPKFVDVRPQLMQELIDNIDRVAKEYEQSGEHLVDDYADMKYRIVKAFAEMRHDLPELNVRRVAEIVGNAAVPSRSMFVILPFISVLISSLGVTRSSVFFFVREFLIGGMKKFKHRTQVSQSFFACRHGFFHDLALVFRESGLVTFR